MIDLEKVLLNIVKPLCSEPDSVMVKQMESLNDNELLLYVYAPSEDIARLIGKKGSIPGLGRSLGEGNGYSLQYSCLGNPIDREAWWGYSPWGCKSWT